MKTQRQYKWALLPNSKKQLLLLSWFLGLLFTSQHKVFAQYDSIHYMPPLAANNNANNVLRHNWLSLSTNRTDTFKVYIKNGMGNIMPGGQLNVSDGYYDKDSGYALISANYPLLLRVTKTSGKVYNIVYPESNFLSVDTTGLTFSSLNGEKFFVNLRQIADNQAGSLTCKGNQALGKRFRVGVGYSLTSNAIQTRHVNFISVMAVHDNTTVTFGDPGAFKTGVTFSNGTTTYTSQFSITLDAGESYVAARAAPGTAPNDYNGFLVTSNKNIAVNSGALTIEADDDCIDQLVPETSIGDEYIIVKGNGNISNGDNETVIVVATQDTTVVEVDGSPVDTLYSQGDYSVIRGNTTNFSNNNMYITTSKVVYVYQTFQGSTTNGAYQTIGMNLIPPKVYCPTNSDFVIGRVKQFNAGGSQTKVNIICSMNDTVYIWNDADVVGAAPIDTIYPGHSNPDNDNSVSNVGDGQSFTYEYRPTVNADFRAKSALSLPIAIGFMGGSGNAGGGGYFSPFPSFSLNTIEPLLDAVNTTRVYETYGVTDTVMLKVPVESTNGCLDTSRLVVELVPVNTTQGVDFSAKAYIDTLILNPTETKDTVSIELYVHDDFDVEVSEGFLIRIYGIGRISSFEDSVFISIEDNDTLYLDVNQYGTKTTRLSDINSATFYPSESFSPGSLPREGSLVTASDTSITYIALSQYAGLDTASMIACYTNYNGAMRCDTVTTIYRVLDSTEYVELDTIMFSETGSVCDASLINHTPDSVVLADSSSLLTWSRVGSCYQYTPKSGVFGYDTAAVVACNDGVCDTTLVPHWIPGPFYDEPVTITDFGSTYANEPTGGNVLDNDDGSNLTVQISGGSFDTYTLSNGGTLTLYPDGTYVYTPATGFVGEETHTFTVCDDASPQNCVEEVLTLTVLPKPDPASGTNSIIANPDKIVSMGNEVAINLLTNDADPEWDNITFSGVEPQASPGTYQSSGSLLTIAGTDTAGNAIADVGNLNISTDGTVSFRPALGFVGTAQLNYQICDDRTVPACAVSTLYIQVLDTVQSDMSLSDQSPYANDDFAATDKNTPVSGNFSGNDVTTDQTDGITVNGTVIDETGSADSVTTLTTDEGGAVTLYADGTFKYTPPSNFVGEDLVAYQICDTTYPVQCATATIHLLVADVSRDYGDVGNDTIYSRYLDSAGIVVGANPFWLGATTTADGGPFGDNSDGGDDGLLYPSVLDSANSLNNLHQIIVNSTKSGVKVYFKLNIDWDNDGDFEDSYAGHGITGSPDTVDVYVSTPPGFPGGTINYLLVAQTDSHQARRQRDERRRD